jgi:hypothetical protein
VVLRRGTMQIYPRKQIGPMIPELDIYRAAQKMIEMFELDAGWHAGLRADHLLDQGDLAGFDVWRRIVAAIKDLQGIEPLEKDMRH